MNYTLRIPPEIKASIAQWGLPRPLLVQVYARLRDELAADPSQHLGGPVVPLAARSYRLVLLDSQLPYRHSFFFAVEIDEQQRELAIVGCRHTTDAGESN